MTLENCAASFPNDNCSLSVTALLPTGSSSGLWGLSHPGSGSPSHTIAYQPRGKKAAGTAWATFGRFRGRESSRSPQKIFADTC